MQKFSLMCQRVNVFWEKAVQNLVMFIPIFMADSSDDSSDDYNVYNDEKKKSKQMLLC